MVRIKYIEIFLEYCPAAGFHRSKWWFVLQRILRFRCTTVRIACVCVCVITIESNTPIGLGTCTSTEWRWLCSSVRINLKQTQLPLCVLPTEHTVPPSHSCVEPATYKTTTKTATFTCLALEYVCACVCLRVNVFVWVWDWTCDKLNMYAWKRPNKKWELTFCAAISSMCGFFTVGWSKAIF